MEKLSDLRLSKNMKYTALYWAMRFFEHTPDVFEKTYSDGTHILINSNSQEVFINGKLSFLVDSHESFVKLECINRILSLGFSIEDFALTDGEFELLFKGYSVRFIVWDDKFKLETGEKTVIYKSRLVSGVLEYKTKIHSDNEWYDYGLFEGTNINLKKAVKRDYDDPRFVIEENRVMHYVGKDKIVVVPEGITELESSSFWDNQYIEEVVLPDSLINMGGDTFYNCKNLRKINVPKNVSLMGNNPFAGCPFVKVKNESPYFIFKNNVLYTKDMETIIYCSIDGDEDEFVIPDAVKIICKHAFFLCDRFKKITLPASLEKMENNPFSGCSNLELINNSKAYFIKDDVIYNGFRTSVVGTLNKIKSDRLELLEGIKTINRNSFWNCKGIKTIVFPKTLIDIGYNPFVECSNIRFESHSPRFKVIDDVLYNFDESKIICYPAWKAVGHVKLPESVITLERGAFSGCDKMTELDLHNVNIVNKSCFTNCSSLKSLYCSDLVTYVGEWAFAYCSSLKEVSVYNDTIVDNNAFSNCPAKLLRRKDETNYIIESENLYTLKSMQKAYKGLIDSILIDPPYNSHIDYIGYKDADYTEGYLAFMGERLNLAYKLLSNKGFLILNIDEGERDNLLELCSSIFGKEFVTLHRWKKKHPFFDANRVVLNPNKVQTDYEYIIVCKKSHNSVFNKIKQPYIDGDLLFEKDADVPETFDCFGTTSSAKDEINELFGTRDYFSTPKPVKLMKELIRATTDKNSMVLDFFAGSGTVGHAIEELNNEDGGNRHYILVSNSESNICKNVTVKRMEITGSPFVLLD
ncbi:MAG: leucine-rich repeat protein [Bacilli bacterium]|nr:leucine-rich repeat protein [Bacilli bacterium]